MVKKLPYFHGRCPLGRGRHNVKSVCICVYICARHFHTNVWSTQGNFYPKVSLTHLPHLGFLASLNCADLRFLILSEQCHTQISLDCTGNISVVPGRNLLKFLILHNTVNVNHWLTLKYDLCTVHAQAISQQPLIRICSNLRLYFLQTRLTLI